MSRYESWIERYLKTMESTADQMLRWHFQKKAFYEDLMNDKQIDRIADRVLSRMSVSVDASDVIAAIDDIQQRLDRLGK